MGDSWLEDEDERSVWETFTEWGYSTVVKVIKPIAMIPRRIVYRLADRMGMIKHLPADATVWCGNLTFGAMQEIMPYELDGHQLTFQMGGGLGKNDILIRLHTIPESTGLVRGYKNGIVKIQGGQG